MLVGCKVSFFIYIHVYMIMPVCPFPKQLEQIAIVLTKISSIFCDEKLDIPTVLLLVELTTELWECLRIALCHSCTSRICDIDLSGESSVVTYWSAQVNYYVCHIFMEWSSKG